MRIDRSSFQNVAASLSKMKRALSCLKSQQSDQFERIHEATQTTIDNVKVACNNRQKRIYIQKAIKACTQQGFDLKGLKIAVSAQENKAHHLSWTETTGIFLPKENKIFLLSGMNWKLLQNTEKLLNPTWKKNVYSGCPSHLVLHEIGHFLHHKNIDTHLNLDPMSFLSYHNSRMLGMRTSPLTDQEKKLIEKEIGKNDHYTSSEQEFVAEMFAGLMGGKKFSKELCHLYMEFKGPTPPDGRYFSGFYVGEYRIP